MKTKTIAALSILATAGLLRSDAAPAAACCAPSAPATKAACCADENSATSAASGRVTPISSRSLYQLDATWTNDAGRNVSLASLRGRPVIAAMFFAQCEYACPILVHDMQRLRAALPEGVREKVQLVLVTFDTARDTPASLKAFRERMSLDANWTLLRADNSAVQELAMLLGVKFKQDARGQFAHSNLLTILNAEGEVVHQHAGLNGDISEAARAVAVATK